MMRFAPLLAPLLTPVLLWAGTAAAEPLHVFVSVLPMQTFVERVGGDHVQVTTMVKPGQSPATYEPTPRQMAELGKTALYVRVGVPFEAGWMDRIRATSPRIQVLDARDGLSLRTMGRHTHEADQGGDRPDQEPGGADRHVPSEMDPHVWTSPPLVKHMARSIHDALVSLDPGNAGDYDRNLAAFESELDRLDAHIRALLANIPGRRFMVFHPAWGYFAQTYGLEQVPIEHAGKEPGPRALAALIDQARRSGVKVIFVQPQFPKKSAEQVAHAIGGRVVAADPLAADYGANLTRVAEEIAAAARP